MRGGGDSILATIRPPAPSRSAPSHTRRFGPRPCPNKVVSPRKLAQSLRETLRTTCWGTWNLFGPLFDRVRTSLKSALPWASNTTLRRPWEANGVWANYGRTRPSIARAHAKRGRKWHSSGRWPESFCVGSPMSSCSGRLRQKMGRRSPRLGPDGALGGPDTRRAWLGPPQTRGSKPNSAGIRPTSGGNPGQRRANFGLSRPEQVGFGQMCATSYQASSGLEQRSNEFDRSWP